MYKVSNNKIKILKNNKINIYYHKKLLKNPSKIILWLKLSVIN